MSIVTLQPIVKAEDLFHQLNPEDEQKQRGLQVERTPSLDEIVNCFEKLTQLGLGVAQDYSINQFYELSTVFTPKNPCSKDIENFSIMLSDFQNRPRFRERAGTYLSALINKCAQDEVTILTKHIEGGVSYVGRLNNGKKITILGDVSGNCGELMESGEIHVRGNTYTATGDEMSGGLIHVYGDAGFTVGYKIKGGEILVEKNSGTNVGQQMVDGKIIIKGNADMRVGNCMEGGVIEIFGNTDCALGSTMKNGKIIIYGDAGREVGFDMRGGEIHLHGNYRLADRINSGDIYNRGKLIVKDGRVLE